MVLGNCISDHEGNHIRQRHRCRKRSRDLHTTESWLSQSRVVTLIDSLWCFGKKVLDYPNWESRYIRLSMDWISESPSWVPLILLSVIHGLSQEIFARSAKHTPNLVRTKWLTPRFVLEGNLMHLFSWRFDKTLLKVMTHGKSFLVNIPKFFIQNLSNYRFICQTVLTIWYPRKEFP